MNFGQNGGNMGFFGQSNSNQNIKFPGAAQLPNFTGQSLNNQSFPQQFNPPAGGGFLQNSSSTFKNSAEQGGIFGKNNPFQQQNSVSQSQSQSKKQPIQRSQNSKSNPKQFSNQNNLSQPNQQIGAIQDKKNGPQGFLGGFQPAINQNQQNPVPTFGLLGQHQQQNNFQNPTFPPQNQNQTNSDKTQKQQSKNSQQKMRSKSKTNNQKNEIKNPNSFKNHQIAQTVQNQQNQFPSDFKGNDSQGFMVNAPQTAILPTQNPILPSLNQIKASTNGGFLPRISSSEKPFKIKHDLRQSLQQNSTGDSKNQKQLGQGSGTQSNQKKDNKKEKELKQFNQKMNNKNNLDQMKAMFQQHSKSRSQTKPNDSPKGQKTFPSQATKTFSIKNVKKDIQQEVNKQEHEEQNEQDYGGEEYGEEEQQEEDQQKMLQQPCVFYLQNKCRNQDCKHLHLEIPKVVEEQCPHFIFKTCSYGEKCKKNHSDSYKENYLQKYMQAWKIQLEKKYMQSQFEDQAQNLNQSDEPKAQKVPKAERPVIPAPQQQIVQPVAVPAVIQYVQQESDTKKFMKELEIEQIKLKNLQKDPNFLNDPKFVADQVLEYIQKFRDIQSQPQVYELNQKATCLKMCPQIDVQDPYRDKSHLERSSSDTLFSELAIKRFMRSDAGKNMTDPELLRPPIILWLTMEYMRDCLVDQDLCPPDQSFYMYQKDENGNASLSKRHQFNEIYSFMKDRTRQLSQDMSIINLPPNQYSINCLEQISRYLIVAAHDGMRELNFDIYTNLKQLTGCLGDLRDKQYNIVRRTFPQQQASTLLKNENEMFLYQLIASSNDLEGYQKMLDEIKHFDIKFQGQWEIIFREAIAIAQSVQLNDFVRFFKLFRKTNYMFACLMLNFVEQMRSKALQVFQKGFGNQGHPNCKKDCQFFMKYLCLPNIIDAKLCLKAFGFQPQDSSEYQDAFYVNLYERQSPEVWTVLVKKFRQQNYPDNLEKIKESKLKRDMISGSLSQFILQSDEELKLFIKRQEDQKRTEEIIKKIEENRKKILQEEKWQKKKLDYLKAFEILEKFTIQESFKKIFQQSEHILEQRLIKIRLVQIEQQKEFERKKREEAMACYRLEQSIKLEKQKQLLDRLKQEAQNEKNSIFEKKILLITKNQTFKKWQNYLTLIKQHLQKQKEREPLEFIQKVYPLQPSNHTAKKLVSINQPLQKKAIEKLSQKMQQSGTIYFILPKGIVREYLQNELRGCQVKFMKGTLRAEVKSMFAMVPDCLNVFCAEEGEDGFWTLDQLSAFQKQFFEDKGLLVGSGVKVNVFVVCGQNTNVQKAQKSFEKVFQEKVILLMLGDLNDKSFVVELLNRCLVELDWGSLMPYKSIIQKKRNFDCHSLKEIILQRTNVITQHLVDNLSADPLKRFREQLLMFVDALEDVEYFVQKSHQQIFHSEADKEFKLCNLRALMKIKRLRQIPTFQKMQISNISDVHFDKVIQDVYIPSLIMNFTDFFSQDEFNNQVKLQYKKDHNWFKIIILQILTIHFVMPYKTGQKNEQILYVDHEEIGQTIPKLNIFQLQKWQEKPTSHITISKNEVTQCLSLHFPRNFDIEKSKIISYNLRKRGLPCSSSIELSEILPPKKRIQKVESKNPLKRKPIKKQEVIEEIETNEDHSIYEADSPQESNPWYKTLIDSPSTLDHKIYIDLERELNLLEQRLY